MLFVSLVVMTLGLIVFLNFSDAEVRERDYFYSSGFYFFAIYIGIGAASILNEARAAFAKGRLAAPATVAACAVFLALPMFTLKRHYLTHDRSRNTACSEYARNMLVCLEPNAVLFTNGDNDTFPLWYVQEVEGYRRDVRVVNLSLLNTPWYIKQCRDNEPRVPIAWTDDQIDRLQLVPSAEGWILVRDQAVNHILRNNNFQRPVYFAVTIPPATFAPYREIMEMEGLAYKVVNRRGENMVNMAKLEDCIVNQYTYGAILTRDWVRDRSIYLQPYIEHLIQNYAAAFVQLAYAKHQDGDYASALKYMKVANEISPHLEPPYQLLGYYYLDAGDTAAAIQHYTDRLRQDPGDQELAFRLGGLYERLGEYGKALDMIEPIYRQEPTARDLNVMVFSLAARAGQVERARGYMTEWLRRHPDDTEARAALDGYERQLRGEGK
jgi:tetratricopeptide (TPR) repeat protein